MMTKRLTTLAAIMFLCAGMSNPATAQERTGKSIALTPAHRLGEDWWKKRFEKNVHDLLNQDAEVLIIGDSITHGWDGQKDTWKEAFGDWRTINMGFSGDRTEHVLWRFDNGPMSAVKPKAIMLMIGTNNVGHGSSNAKETAEGIQAIVEKLEGYYPETPVLVLDVFPRSAKASDDMRKKVDEINSYLTELLKDRKNVERMSVNAKFLDADGNLPNEIMPDALHPNTEGYKIWASSVHPVLKKMVEDR